MSTRRPTVGKAPLLKSPETVRITWYHAGVSMLITPTSGGKAPLLTTNSPPDAPLPFPMVSFGCSAASFRRYRGGRGMSRRLSASPANSTPSAGRTTSTVTRSLSRSVSPCRCITAIRSNGPGGSASASSSNDSRRVGPISNPTSSTSGNGSPPGSSNATSAGSAGSSSNSTPTAIFPHTTAPETGATITGRVSRSDAGTTGSSRTATFSVASPTRSDASPAFTPRTRTNPSACPASATGGRTTSSVDAPVDSTSNSRSTSAGSTTSNGIIRVPPSQTVVRDAANRTPLFAGSDADVTRLVSGFVAASAGASVDVLPGSAARASDDANINADNHIQPRQICMALDPIPGPDIVPGQGRRP